MLERGRDRVHSRECRGATHSFRGGKIAPSRTQMIEPQIQARLRELYPAIGSLPVARFAALTGRLEALRVPAKTMLFEERSPCRGFPLLLEGRVRVAKVASSGREIVLYRVVPGEACILTSSCLLGRRDYSARGTAEGKVVLLALPVAEFNALVATHEPFREYVFGLFGERMAELMQLVEAVAFQRLDQRIAALLLGKGASVHATHQALAEELGSVREIVTRLLRHLAEAGLVSLGRERIEILDPAGLRRLAGGGD